MPGLSHRSFLIGVRVLFGIVVALGLQRFCNGQDAPLEVIADPLQALAILPTTVPHKTTKEDFWQGWKNLPPDLLKDQKKIYTYPWYAFRKENLKTSLAFIGLTAGMVAVDPYPAGYFQKTKSFNSFNKIFSGPNTAKANYLIPLGLYAVGLARRDNYAQQTFLYAGEAVLDAELLTSIMKDVDRRLNPHGVPVNGDFSDTWFKKPFAQNLIGGNGSFPSGHTIAAFAVSTVYADRYPKYHRVIQIVAYSLAAIDGFSRMTLQSHFGSDVFAGAILGYVIAHKVVLGPR
jgi:membrane-associated phospholipid phosphatase